MRFINYFLIAVLLVGGCGQESKIFEKGGKTYYEDSSGDLYVLEGTKKVKVEDYIGPQEPKFVDTKSLTRTWTIAPYNFRVNLNLRYLDGLMWKALLLHNSAGSDSFNHGIPRSRKAVVGWEKQKVKEYKKDFPKASKEDIAKYEKNLKAQVRPKPLLETKYFKRLQRRAKGNFLTLVLRSSDGFDLLEIPLRIRNRKENCGKVLTKEGKLDYLECQGKISSVSKETFSLIEELEVGSRVL